jgi:tRNA dimethylallyltransferase
VVGPTASGKTAVVTALAALTDIEIVSADSRQVYRGLDVGTAKPTAAERAAAPYHGLDLVAPTERYSAGRFAREATAWIAGARARGRLPVVVGGTGFYLRALFEGLFAEPAFDPARRDRLRTRLAAMPRDALERWAERLDPGFRGGGAQRAARAVEIALLSGRPLSALQRETPGAPGGGVPWYARIVLPRALLQARIAARAEAMTAGGIIAETERLLAAGVPPGAPGLSGVGYPETVAVLEGRLPRADLAAAITAATRRYAKRQETWFRHQLRGPVLELDGREAAGALARTLLAAYRAATT